MYQFVTRSLLTAALLTITASVRAETIYGYTRNDRHVFSFDSATPGTLFNVNTLTGVGTDIIETIALRPANQGLYAVGVNGIYTLDPVTGRATLVSTSSIPYGLSSPLGASFDPNADRLRVIWQTSQFPFSDRNIEIDVDTGQAVEQAPLVYAPGNGSGPPTYIADIAYGADMSARQLYGLDANPAAYTLDTIDPETGLVRRVGPLGNGSASSGAHLSISPLTGSAYAALPIVTQGVLNNTLYTVDLQTGRGTVVGKIGGDAFPVSGTVNLAAGTTAPVPEPRTVLLVTSSLTALGLLAWRRSGTRHQNGRTRMARPRTYF